MSFIVQLDWYHLIKYSFMLANLLPTPFLIRGIFRKWKQILDNEKNDSFSLITIYILKILIAQEILVMFILIQALFLYGILSLYEFNYKTIIFIDDYYVVCQSLLDFV